MSDSLPPYEGSIPIEDRVKDDPKKPWKTIVATGLTAVTAFVTYWIADSGQFEPKEVGEALISAAIASGLVGAGTFSTSNPKTLR